MGVEPEQRVCSECGYVHTSRRNFKKTDDGDGLTCSTGHYTDDEGNLKRNRNTYARH
jgi:hypothetical protein